jgi:hypothetical protein
MIDWTAVAYGVCVSVLFLNAVLLATLIIEAHAARQLDWMLDRIEAAATRWIGRIEKKLSDVLARGESGRDVPDGE